MNVPPLPASDATIGQPQSYANFNSYGGRQPYSWFAAGLPAGMQLITAAQNPQLGIDAQIGGAPLALGTFPVVVSGTDSSSPPVTFRQTFTFKVKAMDNDFPPNPTRGTAYSFYLRPIGGTPPFTWAMAGGALPTGLSLNTTTGMISGTPAENGNFSAIFTITSPGSGGLAITRRIGFNVNSPTSPNIQINNNSPLNDAQPNVPYNFQLNACCAAGSIQWSVSSGALPTGLTLNSATGAISGTPTAAQGNVTFTIQATDSVNASNFGLRVFTINVSPITTNTPTPFAIVSNAYSTTFTAAGGTGPYTWALASNSQPLPAGITLSAGGVLSGTPSVTGGFNFNYIVTDSAAHTFTGSAFLSFTVHPQSAAMPLKITTNGALGTYPIGQDQINLNASGGSGNYTWTVAAGSSLPPGLNIALNPYGPQGQVALVGVATTPNTYAFSLTANDGTTSATQPFTLKITALTVKDQYNLPDAFVTTAYSYTFTPLNFAGNVTFTPTSPALPSGMSLSPGGVLSGTPTAAGTYQVNFSVFDGTDTTYRGYQLVVYAVDLTTPGALPNATSGVAYSTTLVSSGGAGGYRYAITTNGLPGGMSLSSSGTISGTTFTRPGVYTFDVTVTDTANNFYQKWMSIDVIGSSPKQIQVQNPWPVADAVLGVSYGWQFPICCGGTAPYTWTASGLPQGMSIRTGSGITSDYIAPGSGEIWGLASTAGIYPVTVTVTDALGATSSFAFPLHVSVLSAIPGGFPNGTINQPYSTTIEITGGSGPYSVAQVSSVGQVSGRIPDGLTLNTAGVAAGSFTLAGTPIENANYFQAFFKVTDGSGNTLTLINYPSIYNVAGGITINNGPNLGAATPGVNYSNQLSACCVANYSWSVAPGSSLPSGLTLSPGGLLSGVATSAAGTYTFLVKTADAAGVAAPGFRLFTLNVSPINITTGSLPYGNVNALYNTAFTATGGTGTLTWSLAFGDYPPPGLTFGADGTLSGTPTQTGAYELNVIVTDQNSNTATANYVINIYASGQQPPLAITDNGALGRFPIGFFNINLNATGGSGNYTWTVASGSSLPPGLNIAPNPFGPQGQVALVGVATTPGNYAFSLTLNDGNTSVTQPFVVRITGLTVMDTSLPDAFANTAYSAYTFTPLNNAGHVTFTSTNTLPPGMTFSNAGVLSGTPTTPVLLKIFFSIFDGTDTIYRGFGLTVYAVNLTTPGALPNATQGVAYSATLTASGGTGGYTYAITGGNLPSGLSLNGGVISGTPNGGEGVSWFYIKVTDSSNNSYQKTMSIDVVGGTVSQIRITLGSFPDAIVGNGYSLQISTCCGGTAPFTWTASGLPPGMSIRSGSGVTQDYVAPGWGEIWGVASTPNNYNVTVTVTDSLGASASLTFPLHVSVLDLAPCCGLPNGTINTPYSLTTHIVGGSGSYISVAQISGALPDGLAAKTAAAAAVTLTVAGTPLENGSFCPNYFRGDGRRGRHAHAKRLHHHQYRCGRYLDQQRFEPGQRYDRRKLLQSVDGVLRDGWELQLVGCARKQPASGSDAFADRSAERDGEHRGHIHLPDRSSRCRGCCRARIPAVLADRDPHHYHHHFASALRQCNLALHRKLHGNGCNGRPKLDHCVWQLFAAWT